MPKERRFIYSALGLLVFAGSAFYFFTQHGHNELPENIVAQVGDSRITTEQFSQYVALRGSAAGSLGVKQQLLDEMIQREAQIAVARQLGYDSVPEVTRALQNALIAQLRDRQLNARLDQLVVSDDEIDAYYQANIQKYTTPAQNRLAIVRFDLFASAPEEQARTVTELATRVHKLAQSQPEDVRGFGTLAARYSNDQASRYVGGDIGWHSASIQGLDPAVKKAIAELEEIGSMSPIVQGGDALYLVKLLDKREQVVTPASVVASNIRVQLTQQKRREMEAEWIQSVISQARPITVNTEALARITPANGERVAAVRPPELPQ